MLNHYVVPIPDMEQPLYKLSPLLKLLTKPERYSHDAPNKHHWTTSWVYNKILPMFVHDFHLENEFNKITFTKHPNQTALGDYTYYTPSHCDITFKNLTTGHYRTGDNTCLHGYNGMQACDTEYHKLFLGAHSVSVIINKLSLTDRTLFILGDSMTIPLIPLIVPFFGRILTVDARNPDINPLKFNKRIITDCMSLFTLNGWRKTLPETYLKYVR